MRRFLLAFGLFLVAELAVIIKVGSSIGAFNTITVLFCSIVLGVILLKLKFKQAMIALHQSQLPSIELLLWLLAGVLFIVPGFISDCVAILLLLPPLRRLISIFVKSRYGTSSIVSSFFSKKVHSQGYDYSKNRTSQNGPRTIDSTCTEIVDAEIIEDNTSKQKSDDD